MLDSKFYNPFIFRYDVKLAGLLTFLGLRSEPEKDEDPLIKTIKLGILSIMKENYDDAEIILHLALKIAQERQDAQGITYVYDMLANVSFNKKEWKTAEILFVETMKRMISSGTDQTDNAIVEMSMKIAQIYDKLNKHDKAVDGFKFCIKTQQEKLKKFSNEFEEELINAKALLGMVHSAFALYFLNRNKFGEAFEQYNAGLKISLDINGEENPQTLVLMNDVGTVHSLLKRYNEAAELINKAIKIGEKISSPDLPAFYCNLAAVELRRKNVETAEKACQIAIDKARKLEDKSTLEEALLAMQDIKQHSSLQTET